MDSSGNYVSTDEVSANPSRVAAIVYSRGPADGGPRCGTFGQYVSSGSGSTVPGTTAGYREIVLGNIAMVKRFSLGTEEIGARLDQDISALEAFDQLLRGCPAIAYDANWNAIVSCAWESPARAMPADYVNALAIPSDYYQPTSENIRHIIETLESDGFVVDPYVVDVK